MAKNKKLTSIIFIIVVIVIFMCLLLWLFTPGTDGRHGISIIIDKAFIGITTRQGGSKFTISGKIVDDVGQPVDQVKVYISQTYLTNGGTSERDRDSQQTVNSDFKLELSGGSETSLGFYKDGYYSVKNKNYPLPSTRSWIFGSNVVLVDNQQIVMERTGTLAKYKRKSNAFFIRKENFFTFFSIPIFDGDGSKEYPFADILNLPPGIIYPNVERDEDGKIIKVVIDNGSRLGPSTVSVNMVGGENDGFILIKDPPPRGIIGIKEAPESGYVKQMVFHWPEDMQETFYFYYKYGNCYGKGIASSFGCTAGGEIMIDLDLFQNIETSANTQVRRNLRTRE